MNIRKKIILSLTILSLIIIITGIEVNAVPAYPFPFQFTQPNGSVVTIQLKGDERVHWAETMDGYSLLNNGTNGWEYAIISKNGEMVCSGVLARNPENRSTKEKALLKKTAKKLSFSINQKNILISFYNQKTNYSKSSVTNQNAFNNQKVFTPFGNKKLLMILIGYSDQAFTKTQTDFNNLMNQVGYNLNGAVGSVKDYFHETSYNNFDITTTVAGPYTASQNMAYYGANVNGDDVNASALITEAVTSANIDVNFADFDNDGDGSVDGVYVLYAGYGEADGGGVNTIWPHAGSITPLSFDGVTISKYSCSNELRGGSGSNMTTIGVICHEFGHVCGAKDYYDTDYTINGQYDGTGSWDLMAGGSWGGSPSGCRPPHMNPYDKIRCQWAVPILLNSDASVTMTNVTTNPVIYRYNTTTANEYYLLENRQQTGFNLTVPGHGMMIYHVDDNYISTAGNSINAGSHQGMFPMSAIATNANGVHISTDNKINVSGCPWPGTSAKTTFTDATTPNSKSWAGANTSSALTNIVENSGNISFCYISCPTINPVFNFTATGASSTQINLNWINNNLNTDVIIATNSSNTFGNLVNGTTYNVNDVLSGGGTILYKGTLNNFNHTGLTAITPYYYKIWAYNSTPNYSSGITANAATLCSSVAVLPFNEGFEGGAIPGCWTQQNLIGSNPWDIQTGGTNGHPSGPHNGTKIARCRTTTIGAGYVTKLISLPINLNGTTLPVLKFWHTQDNDPLSFSGQDVLRVYYRTSALGTWNLLATYINTLSSWTLETVNLPNPSSTYYIAFEATVNAGFGICLDDVEIQPNDCVAGTWLGSISNDWFNPANWCGSVPSTTSNVIIPSGTTNNPLISASGANCQNLTINNGATLSMSGSVAYTLSVNGDFTNNGAFSAGIGTVNFNGTNALQTIGGTSTTTFNVLQVQKGVQSNILEATSIIAFPTSPTLNPLIITSGTFKLSSASTINFSSNQFDIYGGIWNNGGTINSTSNNCVVYGLFKNTSGTTNIQRLYYSGSSIIIEGGNVNISAQIRPFNSGIPTTTFSQNGGTLTLSVAVTSASASPFELTSSSSFTMSNGTIAIQKNSSSNSYDYYNIATTSNVTGGTLQIGNASTPASQTIRINSTAPIYNLLINANNSPIGKLVSNTLTVKNDFTISGGTLNSNNLALNVGGNWTNNGSFTQGTSIVTFNGSTSQLIGGTTAPVFSNLTIDGTDVSLGTSASPTLTTVNNSLIINSGKKLTIPSLQKLTVSGTITNNAGVSGLVINSDVNATGSLIYNGTTVSGSVERFITAYTSAYNGWRLVSSPVNNASIGNFAPGAGEDFYSYDETQTLCWQYQNSGSFVNGNGYLAAYNASGAKTFSGSLNNANILFNNLSKTTDQQQGWHLLGNPFTSALIWNDGNWALSNVSANAKVLNAGGTWTDVLPNGIIPAMQGFWIQVTNTTNSITIPAISRTHSAVNLLNKSDVTERLMLKAASIENSTYVESVIKTDNKASNGFDADFDAKFLAGLSGAPQLYSLLPDYKLSTNIVLPIGKNEVSIAMGFVAGDANSYQLTADGINTFNCSAITLEDSKTNTFQNLMINPVYNFSAISGDNVNRFIVHFNYKGNNDIKNNSKVIYSFGSEIYVNSTETVMQISIYNPIGQLIYTVNKPQGLFNYSLNGKSKGCYLVKLVTDKNTYSEKVIIK